MYHSAAAVLQPIIWQTVQGICALLYNPALPYRSDIEQIIPATLPKQLRIHKNCFGCPR
jgi:hypothetical protein